MKPIFIFLLIFLSPSCSEPESQESERAELDDELAAIMAYIETGVCTDDSNCRYAAIGSKPCGGPWRYAFFPTSLDTTFLLGMINGYNARDEAYNRKWRVISDCAFVDPPDSIACSDGKCVGYAIDPHGKNGVPVVNSKSESRNPRQKTADRQREL